GPLADTLRRLLAERARIETSDFLATLPKFAAAEAAVAPAPVLHAEEILGPYRLIREIGRGGMSSVWLAQRADGTLKRPIALKLPHPGALGAQFAERLGRERDILASLNHPNI